MAWDHRRLLWWLMLKVAGSGLVRGLNQEHRRRSKMDSLVPWTLSALYRWTVGCGVRCTAIKVGDKKDALDLHSISTPTNLEATRKSFRIIALRNPVCCRNPRKNPHSPPIIARVIVSSPWLVSDINICRRLTVTMVLLTASQLIVHVCLVKLFTQWCRE